jgi:hypothetical protein
MDWPRRQIGPTPRTYFLDYGSEGRGGDHLRTRLLSDQLSDYRVGGQYIQAHLHGPSSRLVLDLDDSPTVLRDEAVKEGRTPQRAPD